MVTISNELNNDKAMEEYEKETGKKAIWRGRVTESFKKWQKGEKIYEKNKERVMILVSDEIKKKWQDFIKENEMPTISKLIRKGVNFFIEFTEESRTLKTATQISHELKEALTIIKGYSNILFENYKDKLDWDIVLKLKTIYDQSIILENKIINNLEKPSKDEAYDILIIEDDALTIELLIDFFQSKGYSCKHTTSASETFVEIRRSQPKLILLDIILPDINGYEICKKIKSIKNLDKIPIYFITALPGSEVMAKLEETGADGYFLKPFDFSKFAVLFDYF